MNLTATSEQSAQTIHEEEVTSNAYPGAWWAIRVVAWISQDTANNKSTIMYKWQIGASNYWPYDLNVRTYYVTINGVESSTSFNLPQDKSNSWTNRTDVQKIVVTHDQDGSFSGKSISVSGFKPWDDFSWSSTITLPTITQTEPEPEPEPTPSPEDEETPYRPEYDNDLDPRFYIYADNELLYAVNDESTHVIDPKLTLGLNQTDSLSFTIPPGHPMYGRLVRLRSTIEVYQGEELIFRGRALSDDTDFFNQKNVYCEGAMSFLSDTVFAPYAAGTYSTAKALFKAAINQHSAQVPNSIPNRKLKYAGCDISAALDPEDYSDDYQSTSDVITSLLDGTGGYIKLKYNTDGTTSISYVNSFGHTTSQIIDFGENITDLSVSIDASELYTSVVCLGAADEETGERLTTGSGSDIYTESASAIASYGRIIRVFTYDDVTDVNELRNLAQYLLVVGVQQTITLTVKAIDLHLVYPDTEKIRIGDMVRIRSVPHGVDSYFLCASIEIDLQNPDQTVYTFGTTTKSLTDLIN